MLAFVSFIVPLSEDVGLRLGRTKGVILRLLYYCGPSGCQMLNSQLNAGRSPKCRYLLQRLPLSS